MRSPFILSILCLLLANTVLAQPAIPFVENKGQWDPRVLYRGEVSNGYVYLRNSGLTILRQDPSDLYKLAERKHGIDAQGRSIPKEAPLTIRSHAWHVDFVGSNPSAFVQADKSLGGVSNYFIGNDADKWAGGCRSFQAVTVSNIYPNIDLRYYTDLGVLKYDLVVHPGGDPNQIELQYDGVDDLSVKDRELSIQTSLGEFKEGSPYTYQAGESGRQSIRSAYQVNGNRVRFQIKQYDRSKTLVIDPSIVFCSFTGSSNDNWGFTATYGPDGSFFGGGVVFDTGGSFPTSTGAYQTTYTSSPFEMCIVKLTPNGSNRVYATYIGGNGEDQPHSLVVDGQGNLYLAGRTNSSNYPVVNNGSLAGSGFDIVVTKLNAAGSALLGSRRIGGSGDDGVNISTVRGSSISLQRNYGDDGRSEIILDGGGNVYVASSTQSNNFPVTAGSFQTTFGGDTQDGVVLKWSSNLSSLQFASYLGGNGNDAAYVLSINPLNSNIYVAGGTESSNLLPGTHTGTVGTTLGGTIDGFVAIINNSGSAVVKSAYIGTSGIDQVFGVQFDTKGFPYLMGQTTGNWPIQNAVYNNPAGKQFIVKLQPDLSAYIYSTAFGSGAATPNISPIAFLVDRCENVYISGWGGFFVNTNGYNSAGTNGLPVTANAFKSVTDGKDLYFIVIKRNAASLLFGSFFGENNRAGEGCDHVDGGTSRFDREGVIYQAICGNCKALSLPPLPTYPTTIGAWSTTNNATGGGQCNLTMLKIDMDLAGIRASVQSSINGVPRDTAGCVPLIVDFKDTIANGVFYEWSFGDGSAQIVTNTPNASYQFQNAGLYNVMLVAVDSASCNIRDTAYMQIRVSDLKATVGFQPVKLPPCGQFNYRFDNTSVPPAPRPFSGQSFQWDFGDGSPRVTTGSAPAFHTFPAPGTYNVKLILVDTGYCNGPDSLIIPVSVATNVRASFSTPSEGCRPYQAVFTNNSISGQTYSWDFGDGATSALPSPTHVYNNPGLYNVVLLVANPNTCNSTDTARFTIRVLDAPIASFGFSPVQPLANTPTTFTNNSSIDAVRFRWDFGDGDSLITTSRTPVVHQYRATGQFQACLTAYNSLGCPRQICQSVQALVQPAIDVPTAFTPQRGDANAILYVRGYGISTLKFTIWNRWGQKVFETNDLNIGWDGTFKGAMQPMDVYVYTLSATFFDGVEVSKKGDITLIR
ncbi:MAG: PKD domain-containing protein [Bacteroidota bacterium]